MTLELTARCNFKCPYCYCIWHENPAYAKPVLDTQGWVEVLKKCAADGVKELLFTGGEVLLRKDLFEILDAAKTLLPDAKLSLFTNASLLTEELLRDFKERRIYLATSLQGLQTYGQMTGTRRSYKRLLKVLECAAAMKWPIVVSMTFTKANADEALNMVIAAVLSGARAVQCGPMMVGGRGLEHPELMLSREKWREIIVLAIVNVHKIKTLPQRHIAPLFYGIIA